MLESFFNKKRKPSFSPGRKYEPAPGKQLKRENEAVKVKKEKPTGKKDGPKVRENLKGIISFHLVFI